MDLTGRSCGKVFVCSKGNTRPYYSLSHDSHESIIKKEGFRNNKLFDRDYVSVQIWPKGCWFDPMVKFNGWGFAVDEESTIPAWFENDRELWFDRCLDEIWQFVLPAIGRGEFPGDFSVSGPARIVQLKRVAGNLNVNGSAVLNAPNLLSVGGHVAVSLNAKLISPLNGL